MPTAGPDGGDGASIVNHPPSRQSPPDPPTPQRTLHNGGETGRASNRPTSRFDVTNIAVSAAAARVTSAP